ncbi:AMP-binding protein [Mongoliibacter ruber]|uniref:O-succinylbenzoic acid--CoA ligase n=1 Tax=Mongoliibacter ruber TaxID=1750599 RepID=A0A2T0WJV1_9BACT|nr:AMP-binding protein [Mongoliibacter ruber]PRY86945.1 O-succinylbenzoic acid--CoA ligase [Mongoliibacter ruber]
MGNFILEKRAYTFNQIKNGQWEETDHYYHQALTFCQLWLKGHDGFEISTSGSTGKPKTILVKRNQMKASASATGAYFKIEQNSSILCCLNTWMIAGKMMLVRGMEWDANVYLLKANSDPLSENWLTFPLDFVAMVPLQVQASINNPISLQKLKQIKNLIIGGAPSGQNLIGSLKQLEINAYQTFGMTETVSHIALASLLKNDLIYETLPGVVIGVDDKDKLWVQGPMSDQKKLQTNDIVEILNDSQFKWLGRADFVINSGGVKVYPETMEEKIQGMVFEYFGATSYFIYGLPDERLGQKVVLVIEGVQKDGFELETFLTSLQKYVNRFHLPKEVFFLPKFEYTASGKTNRLETIKMII